MTYAQKILALVPGGEMQRFGEQEVLLTWSAGERTAGEVAAMADIDEDMLCVVSNRLSLSIPPEIADNVVTVSLEELINEVAPIACRGSFGSNCGRDDWWAWVDGEAYEACFQLITKCAELCLRMGDVDVNPIWDAVGEQCLVYVYG